MSSIPAIPGWNPTRGIRINRRAAERLLGIRCSWRVVRELVCGFGHAKASGHVRMPLDVNFLPV